MMILMMKLLEEAFLSALFIHVLYFSSGEHGNTQTVYQWFCTLFIHLNSSTFKELERRGPAGEFHNMWF